MLYYVKEDIISVGIAGSKYLNIKEVKENAKKFIYKYSKEPYVDSDWWGYLWYCMSKEN